MEAALFLIFQFGYTDTQGYQRALQVTTALLRSVIVGRSKPSSHLVAPRRLRSPHRAFLHRHRL